jgi:hypothetical protein
MTRPMLMSLLLLLLLLLGLPTAQAATPQVFGAAMPTGDAMPISAAVSQAGDAGGGARKFSGRITEVCQKEGCWIMLEDDGQAARVTMKDHAFTLPKDASGTAVVYGTLTVKELDAASAKHLAEDAGKDEPVALREYRIAATSVELAGG